MSQKKVPNVSKSKSLLEEFLSHVILKRTGGVTIRPLVVMVELDVKLTGRAIVFGSAGTGLGPSRFLMGDAHWLRT